MVEDGWAYGHLGPEQLARLDAASFSRFVMAAHQTVSELWSQLEWRLSPEIVRRIHETLSSAGGTAPAIRGVRGREGRAG